MNRRLIIRAEAETDISDADVCSHDTIEFGNTVRNMSSALA